MLLSNRSARTVDSSTLRRWPRALALVCLALGIVHCKATPNDDQDGDGIADGDDACPAYAGPSENNGCPEEAYTGTTGGTTTGETTTTTDSTTTTTSTTGTGTGGAGGQGGSGGQGGAGGSNCAGEGEPCAPELPCCTGFACGDNGVCVPSGA